jgi:uncharacterized membrane protein
MSVPVDGTGEASDLTARSRYANRTLGSGLLFGVGLIAFVDEAVFHQILHWHHFYDRSTSEVGLVSDGVFHALSWFTTIGGLFLLADLRRRRAFWTTRWWGGVLIGAGGFQLYDGLVQHKLLGLHQIRYVPELLVYDLIWNGVALALVAAGVVLTVRTRHRSAETAGTAAERA